MIKTVDKTFAGDAALTAILGWMLPTKQKSNSAFLSSQQSKKAIGNFDNGRGVEVIAVEDCWREQSCFRYHVGVTPALGPSRR